LGAGGGGDLDVAAERGAGLAADAVALRADLAEHRLDRLRAELLKAYARSVRPMRSRRCSARSARRATRVRREARAAFRRYVEGPPPPPAPKRKRRLPGGKEESEEKADYLTYREVAELALQKAGRRRRAHAARSAPDRARDVRALIKKARRRAAASGRRAFLAAQQKAQSGDVEGAVGELRVISPTIRPALVAPRWRAPF